MGKFLNVANNSSRAHRDHQKISLHKLLLPACKRTGNEFSIGTAAITSSILRFR